MINNEYGISPEQYHASLDKLWKAVEREPYNGERDVFTICVDKLRDLEIRLHRISGILHGDLQYSYDDITEMRDLCNTEKSIKPLEYTERSSATTE